MPVCRQNNLLFNSQCLFIYIYSLLVPVIIVLNVCAITILYMSFGCTFINIWILPVALTHNPVSANLQYNSISMSPRQLIIVTLSISWLRATLWHTAGHDCVIQFTKKDKAPNPEDLV